MGPCCVVAGRIHSRAEDRDTAVGVIGEQEVQKGGNYLTRSGGQRKKNKRHLGEGNTPSASGLTGLRRISFSGDDNRARVPSF